MEQQNQDPINPESFSEKSQYAKPALIPAGKGSDGKPTFYIVVNQHGLDRLTENGLITEQRDRINAEFDLIDEAGKKLDNVIRSKREEPEKVRRELSETDIAKESKTTTKTSQEALEELANIALSGKNSIEKIQELQRDLARPDMFIIEVKKDGDVSKATRIFSGEYIERALDEKSKIADEAHRTAWLESHRTESQFGTWSSKDTTPPQLTYIPAHIDVKHTLNLLSSGLPSQDISEKKLQFITQLDMDQKFVKDAPTNSKYAFLQWVFTEETAKQFRESVDKLNDDSKLATAENLAPQMRDALTKAADASYTPATPEGYESPATGGRVAAEKAKGKAA